MPVTILERDEASAANSGYWLHTSCAALGKQLSEALSAVGFLIATSEALTGQRHVAVGAREALPVPRLILVSHATRSDDLVALNASGCELLLVAAGAVDLLLPGYKGLGANDRLADAATEAFLVPLPCLVFHLLGTGSEDITATIAP